MKRNIFRLVCLVVICTLILSAQGQPAAAQQPTNHDIKSQVSAVPQAAETQILFQDDFSGGNPPPGWTTSGDGTWTVENEQYVVDTGYGFFHLAISTTGDDTWTDYSLDYDTTLSRTPGSAVIVRYSSSGYLQLLASGDPDCNIVITDAKGAILASGPILSECNIDNWTHIKVIVQGSVLQVFSNNQLAVNCFLTGEYPRHGKIGLVGLDRGWGHNKVYFDNILVQTLPSYSISGKVTGANGQPLQGVEIRASSGPVLTVAPEVIPADGKTTANVILSGATSGHQVRLISSRGIVDTFDLPMNSIPWRVDQNGQYIATFKSTEPGLAILTVEDLTTQRTLNVSANVTVYPPDTEPPPPSIPGVVVITGVNPTYPLSGRYLEGVHVANHINVVVDWGGTTPGYVDFILNGTHHAVAATSSGASYTLDMGYDLQDNTNTLQMIAYNTVGIPSEATTNTFILLPLPDWIAGLVALGAMSPLNLSAGGIIGFNSGFKIPVAGVVSKDPENFPPNGQKTAISFFLSGMAIIPLSCSEPVGLKLEGGMNTNNEKPSVLGVVLNFEAQASGSLTGELVNCITPKLTGTGRIDLTLTGQKNWPLLVILANYSIPGLGDLAEKELSPGFVNSLGAFYIKGYIKASVIAAMESAGSAPWIQITAIDLSATPGIEAGYEWATNYFQIKAYLGANVELDIKKDLTTPDSQFVWDHATITVGAGAELQLFFWKNDFSANFVWRFPPAASNGPELLSAPQPVNWQFIPHTTGETQFKGQAGNVQAFALSQPSANPIPAQVTATSELIGNVFEYAKPWLALNPAGNRAAIVWTQDDLNKPASQAEEIQFSLWDGVSWSTPAWLTQDYYLDGEPQAAWTADGKLVVVWNRLPEVLSDTTTWDETTAKKMEIATSTYDPSTKTWSPVTLLTTNIILDEQPQLVRNADGRLLAVWKQNDSGKTASSADFPDRIMAAFYDNGWGTPMSVAENIPSVVDLAAGYGTNAATIAYTRFVTVGITPRLEVYTSTWNGASWSLPAAMTNGDLDNQNPRLVYNTTNQPLVVWLEGGSLTLKNLSTNNSASLVLPSDVGGIDQLRLVQDSAGDIGAIFTAQSGQRDLYLSFYDDAHGKWGNPVKLTDDAAAESYPSAGLDANGTLLLAYTTTTTTNTSLTVLDTAGESRTVMVPMAGQTNLMTLAHVFNHNLTLGTGDLIVSNSNPRPGDTVTFTAKVHNTGDLIASGFDVAFYEEDSNGGRILIGKATQTAPLAAGFSADLSLDHTLPAGGGGTTFYAVVDPDNKLAESNEDDNVTSLAAFLPDLAVSSAWVKYSGKRDVGLAATIQNQGASPSYATRLYFYQGPVTGSPLGYIDVPVLAPGQSINLTVPWNSGMLGAGEYNLTAAVNQYGYGENILDNNTLDFNLEILPDIMVNPYYVKVDDWSANPLQVSATVFNNGPVDASNVVVSFYNDPLLDASALINTQTIANIPAGGSTQLSFSYDGALPKSLYLVADPDMALTEITRDNNFASLPNPVSMISKKLYLPLITRHVSAFGATGNPSSASQSGSVSPAQTQLVDATFTTQTDADGNFTLSGLPAGTYRLTAHQEGVDYYPSQRAVNLPPNTSGQNFNTDPSTTIYIAAGYFWMGCELSFNCPADEMPTHQVMLDAYWIDKNLVTNAQYAYCVSAGACTPPYDTSSMTRSSYYGNPAFANYPVINERWSQANDYCAWAGKRLPSEAEWEMAARGAIVGGTGHVYSYPWGNQAPTCSLANFTDGSNLCVGDTSAVGSYPGGASPYGVLDMAGNVWEWVNDWYGENYYSVAPTNYNPPGPASGIEKVVRGGSWATLAPLLRTAYRGHIDPGTFTDIGFRCVSNP